MARGWHTVYARGTASCKYSVQTPGDLQHNVSLGMRRRATKGSYTWRMLSSLSQTLSDMWILLIWPRAPETYKKATCSMPFIVLPQVSTCALCRECIPLGSRALCHPPGVSALRCKLDLQGSQASRLSGGQRCCNKDAVTSAPHTLPVLACRCFTVLFIFSTLFYLWLLFACPLPG